MKNVNTKKKTLPCYATCIDDELLCGITGYDLAQEVANSGVKINRMGVMTVMNRLVSERLRWAKDDLNYWMNEIIQQAKEARKDGER